MHHMHKLVCTLFFGAMLMAATSAMPSDALRDPDRQAQRLETETCALCHGIEGHGKPPTFPALAAQTAPYLEAQLKAFKDQTRADPDALTYMWGVASELSDKTIGALARFYSFRSPAPATALDPALTAVGKTMFDEGLPDQKVPACSSCHGAQGEGNGTTPRIGRQQTAYCYMQLREMRDGLRNAPLMDAVTQNLTVQQFQAVCAYVGSL
jgi:cytochrome c553